MKKRNRFARLTVLSFALCLAQPAISKPSSGGGSKPSPSRPSISTSTKSSSSSSLFKSSPPKASAPSAPKPSVSSNSGSTSAKPVTPSTSSGGYSKPGTTTKSPAASTAQTAFAKGNRFDQSTTKNIQVARATESKQAYESSKAKFKPAPNLPSSSNSTLQRKETVTSNTVFRTTRVYAPVSYADIHYRRSSYYSGWSPPYYAYSFSPAYGAWDSTFLMWALWHDSSYGYNHRNDAEYQAFRADAMKLAETNGELKAKLEAQDAKINELAAANAPVDPNYVPESFKKDPVAMLSDDAIQQLPVQKATLRIATGVIGGRYNQVAEKIRAEARNKFDVELVPSAGSGENLKLLRDGKVDAAIVQSDTDFVEKEVSHTGYVSDTEFHQALVFSEYVMLIVQADSSINSVEDLKKGTTVHVGPNGSGAGITWLGICMQDVQYKDVEVVHGSYEEALDQIRHNKQAAMLFVAGSHAPLLERAGRSSDLKLVPVNDKDLSRVVNDKGEPVYDSLLITSNAYPGLQKDGKELETLAVDAKWTISDAWVQKFGNETFELVNDAVINTIASIHIDSIEAKPKYTTTSQNSTHSTPTNSGRGWLFWILVISVIASVGWYVFYKHDFN